MKKYLRLMLSIPLLVLLLAASGCSDAGTSANGDDGKGVLIYATTTGLLVTNTTEETVYYFAIEQQAAAYVDWRPACMTSNAVAARSSREIQYPAIVGYKPGCIVDMYVWNGTQANPPGLRAGTMRTLTVTAK